MPQRILVAGATGYVGGYLLDRLRRRGHDATGTSRAERPGWVRLDLDEPATVRAAAGARWDLVVNCAGMASVEACAADPALARRVNVDGPAALAAAFPCKVVQLSSDYVFDGRQEAYTEDDPPAPLSVYGETKVEAERAVLAADPGHLVLRLPLVYGHHPPCDRFLDRFRDRAVVEAPDPAVSNPLYLRDLADGLGELAALSGVVHAGGGTVISRLDFYRRLVAALGLPVEVRPAPRETGPVGRPERSALLSRRTAWRGRPVDEGLAALAREVAGAG